MGRKTFLCWSPDMGHDGPDDGREVRAFNAECAAEEFHQRYDSDSAEVTERLVVFVRAPDGTVTEFCSRAEYEVNYYAYESKPGSGTGTAGKERR